MNIPNTLQARVDDACVIGIGEPTHGQADVHAARYALARTLIEHHDFTTIAFEAPADGWSLINDGLLAGDVSAFTRQNVGYWMYWTAETRDFLSHLATRIRDGHAAQVVGVDVVWSPDRTWSERDRMMADALGERVGEGERVIYLAHNGHITTDAGWLAEPDWISTGMELRHHVGDQYVAIGTVCGRGDFLAYPIGAETSDQRQVYAMPDLPPDSLERQLEVSVGDATVLLDVANASKDVQRAIERNAGVVSVGAEYDPTDTSLARPDIAACFDALLSVPTSDAITVAG